MSSPPDSIVSWDFARPGDMKGWSVSAEFGARVTGSSLWLSMCPPKIFPETIPWGHQMHAPARDLSLLSPPGAEFDASSATKVRIRVLNRSPETDGFLSWRTASEPDRDQGPIRFTMVPHCNEWQEVICHVDTAWSGRVVQLRITPVQMGYSGEMWIDWIAITDESHRELLPRPDVCSDKVVPRITLPQITQEDFQDAFRVLDECLVIDVPVRGFPTPVMGPGGIYGANWWQLDSSLNLAGAKWVNQEFAENTIRGFFEVQCQNPDGRIDLWGGAPIRGIPAETSSIPRYFEVAHDVARRSHDPLFQEAVLDSMDRYLAWWLSPVKRDTETGLVTAVAEETFGEKDMDFLATAAVDLNVAVAVGLHHAAELALYLGRKGDADRFEKEFKNLRAAINHYLWNEERGAYFNYSVRDGALKDQLICTTFDTLRLGIAPQERAERMIPLLLDPALFNWGTRPVTSIAMTEPAFVEAMGPYDGRAWFGDLWTMRNLPIIEGLVDLGRHDLAAEIAWSTIKTFNANYTEFVVPSTGSGEGVQRYGWSASQYIQAIVEFLFGVDYDTLTGRLRVFPHIPEELVGKRISIDGLILPSHPRSHLSVVAEKSSESLRVDIRIAGEVPSVALEVVIEGGEPGLFTAESSTGKRLLVSAVDGIVGAVGVRVPLEAIQTITLR